MSTHRDWLFTINNPTEEDLPDTKWNPDKMSLLVYQKEQGTNGTPHFQGLICLRRQQRISYMKKLLPRAHWEARRGTRQQAYEYVTKQDTRIEEPVVFGEYIESGHRTDIEEVMDMVKQGSTEEAIAEHNPRFWFKNYRAVARYRMLKMKSTFRDVAVYWVWGGTGTGKSRWVYEHFPDAYWKPPETCWFDGYDGEQVIVLDDYRKNWFTFSYMLRLLDKYPMQVQTKGGSQPLLATTFVITSPEPPEQVYITREDVQQLLRRVTYTYHSENLPSTLPE